MVTLSITYSERQGHDALAMQDADTVPDALTLLAAAIEVIGAEYVTSVEIRTHA